MIINHNMGAMNANRNMGINQANANKSMEKLSSGLRINKAGDDAAGLAISEKMRGQIRGLDQASANAQDGISMVQTAEGALSETHSILQRMRELAVQSGNDTNVGVDRTEIQKEMNQLSSEINRIGNTTEFNTQKVLAGDGKANLKATAVVTDGALIGGTTAHANASQATTFGTLVSGDTNKTATWNLNGQDIKVTFVEDATLAADTANVDTTTLTGNSVTIKYKDATTATKVGDALTSALNGMIGKNDTLKQNYSASNVLGVLTVAATTGGQFEGSKGSIGTQTSSAALATAAIGLAASVGSTAYVAATKTVDFASLEKTDVATTDANLKALVGTGMTVNGKQVEFYNANDGAYAGNGIGVNINTALEETTYSNKAAKLTKAIADTVGSQISDVKVSNTAKTIVITNTADKGLAGNSKIDVKDGGIQKNFEATLQVGANQGQQFKIDVNDMRSVAINVTAKAGATDAATGAKYTASNSVTNGTDSTTREAALDVSTAVNSTNAVKTLNNAIEKVSSERSKLGAFQNRLEHTIANLGTSSENLTSAESRVRDVNMAKEMSTFSKNNILSQAAQAMLAQANQQPQQVLQLLR